MANRNFNKRQSLEKEVKDIYAKVSIGASGAPTIVNAYGITSITREGAGDYSLLLQDKYASLKFFEVIHLSSSAQDLGYQLHSETVATDKGVRFLCLTGATPTDPASGKVLYIKLELKNTNIV